METKILLPWIIAIVLALGFIEYRCGKERIVRATVVETAIYYPRHRSGVYERDGKKFDVGALPECSIALRHGDDRFECQVSEETFEVIGTESRVEICIRSGFFTGINRLANLDR